MDVSNVSDNKATPKSFLDGRRPLVMKDADRIFDRLFFSESKSVPDLIDISNRLNIVLQSVKTYELDKAWDKFEKEFKKGKDERVQSTTDLGKVMTMLSMFYSAINKADPIAKDTRHFITLRNNYYAARDYLDAKLGPSLTGKDKRTMSNILYSTDERIVAISRHYNERVEAEEMSGPEIPINLS